MVAAHKELRETQEKMFKKKYKHNLLIQDKYIVLDKSTIVDNLTDIEFELFRQLLDKVT